MSAGAHAHGPLPAEYLALGDSYTIGEGVDDGERWPTRLAVALRARGVAIAHPHYIARSGWTSDELADAIDAEQCQRQLGHSYRLVSLQIGVNDQYRERELGTFQLQFSALLDRAIAFAGGNVTHVVVVSIPDWGHTPFAISSGRDRRQIAAQIDRFNAAAEASCHQRGVIWVDITDLSRATDASTQVIADSLHPSPQMYARWVARIAPKVAL